MENNSRDKPEQGKSLRLKPRSLPSIRPKAIVGALRNLAGSDLSNHNLALALALGVFIAPTPIVGVHTWMALGLAFLFRVNRVAAFIGSNASNPFSLIPLTVLDIEIGCWLVGRERPIWLDDGFHLENLWECYGEAWLGSLVVGGVLGLITYLVARLLFMLRRDRFAAGATVDQVSPAKSPTSGD
jgi:uncharacterized protein